MDWCDYRGVSGRVVVDAAEWLDYGLGYYLMIVRTDPEFLTGDIWSCHQTSENISHSLGVSLGGLHLLMYRRFPFRFKIQLGATIVEERNR